MKHVVMTSGGVGSFITLEMVVNQFGRENVVSLFSDTMMEDEDLYRFLDDSHSYLGVPVTRIADGRTPWEVFRDRGFIGNTRVDLCSRILKRELMDDWICRNFKSDECICYVGIDYTEKHRIERLAPRKLPYIYKAPMVEAQMMLSPAQKESYCTERCITPPRLYGMGFGHNNCGGFCVKAGLAQFKLLFEKMPDRYAHHEAIEQSLLASNQNLKPFLRKRYGSGRSATVRYISMKEFREEFIMPDALTDDDKMDYGGCGCALAVYDTSLEEEISSFQAEAAL